MDYEVFLMSRIREEYLHNGQDNGAAVADAWPPPPGSSLRPP
jgi:uncharacterized membrane protein YdfJ with MMPL/SSD domain